MEDLDGHPIGVAEVHGDAWFALAGNGSVARPDEDTPIGRTPLRLAPGPDGVWVSVFGDGRVAMIGFDGEIKTTVSLGENAEPEGLALDRGVLWIVDQAADAALALDTKTGEIIADVPVGDGPRLAAVGTADIWVTTYGTGGVTAVDRATKQARVSKAGVCRGIQGVAEASGVVWVACTVDDSVVALDRDDLSELTRFPLDQADAIASDSKRVFAVGQVGPTVLEIDPNTRWERQRTVLSDTDAVRDGNVDAAVIGEELVVTHPEANRVFRLKLS